MRSVVATKIGMTSIVDKNGAFVPVTLLRAEEHVVTGVRTAEANGYDAVQVATGSPKKLAKSVQGWFTKLSIAPRSTVKEFRGKANEANVGDTYGVEVFTVGDVVSVTGTSKGKGFTGNIKRHNFARGRKTHGGRSYRRPGSIGSMYPQKIFKGKRMAGQDGGSQVTVKNLVVAYVDSDRSVIGVKGAVPGPAKQTVLIKGASA